MTLHNSAGRLPKLSSFSSMTERKSTVLNTDYLVYNADYDHETVKLRKARELKEKGSGIEILTTEEWKKLIDS